MILQSQSRQILPEDFLEYDEEVYNVCQRRLMNLRDPVHGKDAVTKDYLDAAIDTALSTGGGGPLAFPFKVIKPSGGFDSPQINAAIEAGAVLYFSGGDYQINATCETHAQGVHFRCSGTSSTKFNVAPGITGFHFGGVGGNAARGSISGATIIGGNLSVHIDAGNNSFDAYDLSIQNCVHAIQVNGNFNTTPRIDCIQTIIRDIEIHNHSGVAVRIFHNGDTHLTNVRTFGGFAVNSVGILIDSGATAVYATNCNILAADKGCLIRNTVPMNSDPGSLPRPGQFLFTACLFDTCKGYGADIETTFQAKFIGCWFGGTQENEGLLIRSASEVELNGCHFIANAKHGLRVQNGNPVGHIKIIGGHFYTNGRATANTYDGAHFEAGVGHVTMIGSQCYNDTSMNFTDSQRYGITFADGNGNGIILIGNNCLNNMQPQGIYYGATGSERQVIGNLPLAANIGGSSSSGDIITFTTTINPASLPDTGKHVQAFNSTHGVSGVSKGDVCAYSFEGITASGWLGSVHATATNQLTLTLINFTGQQADLPSGTLTIKVFK